MPHRLLTAPLLHDGHRFLPEGSALELSASGAVVAIHPTAPEVAEHFEGILCPGFVNAHCHLELSHMRGVIPQHTGLVPFLQSVVRHRNDFSEEEKASARHLAYEQLLHNGVVAVGDIANTADTLDLRRKGDLHVHSFIECIGFSEHNAAARFAASESLWALFAAQKTDASRLSQSIVPHAPYSVSRALFGLINQAQPGAVLSIHNQECAAEDAYYREKTGAFCELMQGFGIDDASFQASGKSSLQTYLPWLDAHPLILVHNTFTAEEDLLFAQQRRQPCYWCLCPKANLYIEGQLPNLPMLAACTDALCIGTDSLASNTELSVFAELKVLQEAFPETGWERLLRWACEGGAKALGLEKKLGAFRPGMQPGVVQIAPDFSGVLRVD